MSSSAEASRQSAGGQFYGNALRRWGHQGRQWAMDWSHLPTQIVGGEGEILALSWWFASAKQQQKWMFSPSEQPKHRRRRVNARVS